MLDEASRSYLTAHLADVPEPLTRAALVTLWEEMLDGRIAPEVMFQTLTDALPRESDELTVQRMLSYAQQVFWKFLTPDDSARRAAPSSLLRDGLDRASSSSLKSAWFNAARHRQNTGHRMAGTVWRKTEQVPGLTLAEPDYITLALELAVREAPGWQRILDEQQGGSRTPIAAQFEFVRPAPPADVPTRDAFFASLSDVKNRRRESWVLQAVGYLHHPLRAAASEIHHAEPRAARRDPADRRHLFPKRWADATLSGHQSASAARGERLGNFRRTIRNGCAGSSCHRPMT